MRGSRKKLQHDDYTVGWISPLPLELVAAKSMLDEIHSKLPQDPNDHNTYVLGSISGHNVVIACLPSGVYGAISATVVATQMLFTFRALRFGLLVGIGGGVPSETADIRLGDIVVSKPSGTFGGVIQYDYGKIIGEGSFQQTGTLNMPPHVLLTAISELQAEKTIGTSQIPKYLTEARAKYPKMMMYKHPGIELDQLYKAEYDHVEPGDTCDGCDRGKLVDRPPRESNSPEVHYGLIASGNQVMRHALTRDRLSRDLRVLCFEMEAAGLMDHFPCLVIRGICDYSDSHKNKRWQEYAAATAAAYAKELLSATSAHNVLRTARIRDTVSMALLAIASSVIGFLDASTSILTYFQARSATKMLPQVFKDVGAQLPLIVATIEHIQGDCKDVSITPEEQDKLLPVVVGCHRQAVALGELMKEIVPPSNYSRFRRIAGAISRSSKEREAGSILKTLETYKSTLSLYLEQRAGNVIARLCKSEEVHEEFAVTNRQNLKASCQHLLNPCKIVFADTSWLPGTCEWIWKEPALEKWSNPPANSDRLLCVRGPHGCGKSTLALYTAKNLKGEGHRILFFSFSGTDGSRRTLDSLVRTFFWQLLEEASDDKALDVIHSLSLQSPVTPAERSKGLYEIAKLIPETVYCIIDGVDECVDKDNDPIQLLLEYVREIITSTHFQIALFGRPSALQATAEMSPLNIDITFDLIQADVKKFTRAEINKPKGRYQWDQVVQDQVFESLTLKEPDGMFLWVKLIIAQLRKSITTAEVVDRLQHLPRELESLYRDIFLRLREKLEPGELRLAKKVLAFTITSRQVLTVSELQYLCALDDGSSLTLKDRLILDPEQRILDVCGELVNIIEGHVQLAHISVKEFLMRGEEEWSCPDDHKIKNFRMEMEFTHLSLGLACLDYIGVESDEFTFVEPGSQLDTLKKAPLLEYSSRYVISHLTLSGPPQVATLHKINLFIKSRKFTTWVEYVAALLLDDPDPELLGEEIVAFHDWLEAADHDCDLFRTNFEYLLRRELGARVKEFGQDDSRTDRWRDILLGFEAAELLNRRNNEAERTLVSAPGMPSNPIHKMMHLIKDYGVLSRIERLSLFLKLGIHLLDAKILTDPLKLLFEAILGMADKIPTLVLVGIGSFYESVGKLDNALAIFQYLVEKRELKEGTKSTILRRIGALFFHQDRYPEAEKYFQEAVAMSEKVYGKNNTDTYFGVHDLGDVVYSQGRYSEAEIYFQNAVAISENVYGKDDKNTLESIQHLGVAIYCQGRYSESKKLFRRAVKGREKTLGNDNPDTLISMNYLGWALFQGGNHTETEEIFQCAIERREMGSRKDYDDITLLRAVYGLALLLSKQGRPSESGMMLDRAVEVGKRVAQKASPRESSHIVQFAHVLSRKGEHIEAEQNYRLAIERAEKIRGKKHPPTLEVMHYLGWAVYHQGRYSEAEAIHKSAMEGRLGIFGWDQRSLKSIQAVCWALYRQRKYLEAQQVHLRGMEIIQDLDGQGEGYAATREDIVYFGEMLSDKLRDPGVDDIAECSGADRDGNRSEADDDSISYSEGPIAKSDNLDAAGERVAPPCMLDL
ncbi:hypothetical protein ABW19_dt0200762 [Dactylella cylindrospora]|nr:hypothetical protein ABW19_dt0200762 [Dactylella cylindrospora]